MDMATMDAGDTKLLGEGLITWENNFASPIFSTTTIKGVRQMNEQQRLQLKSHEESIAEFNDRIESLELQLRITFATLALLVFVGTIWAAIITG